MKKHHKILLVDDDALLRQALAEQIEMFEEFQTDQAETAQIGMEKALIGNYDLILLDVGLPDMDGREACRALRQKSLTTPIIMLTGANSDADTILGLDAGANDYITKPFKFNVLMARMRAQLRRFEQEAIPIIIGPWHLNPENKQLIDQTTQKTLNLTEKEVALLKYMHQSAGNLVTKDELLQKIWLYQKDVTTHTVETHIYRLRQKIEPDPANARFLITESGGYRLITSNEI